MYPRGLINFYLGLYTPIEVLDQRASIPPRTSANGDGYNGVYKRQVYAAWTIQDTSRAQQGLHVSTNIYESDY